MNKTILVIGAVVALVVIGVIVLGMFKFNYLSGLEGYDVDGNKEEQSNGEIIMTMEVDSQEVDCTGVGPQKCLVVNGEYFYDSIEGFSFEPGYNYVLEVKRTERDNVPADASMYQYELVQVVSRTIDASVQGTRAPDSLYAYEWQWIENRVHNGGLNNVSDPSQFVLVFGNDNGFSSTTDCNSVAGTVSFEGEGGITFGQMASTKKACLAETREEEYVTTLALVDALSITEEGERPMLSLEHENGEMIFMGVAR